MGIMTAGAFPFTEATPRCELFVSLVNNAFQFPEKMSPELKDLLLQMWVIDPSHRITIPQIRQHPWFNLNNALPTPMALSADMDDDLVFQDSRQTCSLIMTWNSITTRSQCTGQLRSPQLHVIVHQSSQNSPRKMQQIVSQ